MASARNHLGLLYKAKGKKYFEKAEYEFLEALKIKEEVFGEKSIEVPNYLDHISQFYMQFGSHEKAVELLQVRFMKFPSKINFIVFELHFIMSTKN